MRASGKVRVLIVDDSVAFRSAVRGALEGLKGIEVAGAASNGKLALQRLKQSQVDLVILDLEMPEMDGLETLREMKASGLTQKVIVFSAFSRAGADLTLASLAAGASDFEPKPKGEPGLHPAALVRRVLLPKILGLFQLAPEAAKEDALPSPSPYNAANWDLLRPKIIVIGSSTGGPRALEEVFANFSAPPNCPILITQHMPPVFTASMAARLEKVSGVPTREARNGEPLLAGKIYVAPGDFHMRVRNTSLGHLLALDQSPHENSVRPAVDPLFVSAAECFGAGCLAFVLTGMGQDGRLGAQAVKRAGGTVYIQSRESCVVFGMPGAVFSSGAFDRIGDLGEIAEALRDKVCA